MNCLTLQSQGLVQQGSAHVQLFLVSPDHTSYQIINVDNNDINNNKDNNDNSDNNDYNDDNNNNHGNTNRTINHNNTKISYP